MPKKSAMTEWSMTSSAGASGSIFEGSPPSSTTASRIVARSTTTGTPVKSCMTTRAGVNWISSRGSADGSQAPMAAMVSRVTLAPSSVRSRFSSSTLWVKGSRAEPSTAAMRKISYEAAPTVRVPRAPKLSLLATGDLLRSGRDGAHDESILTSRYRTQSGDAPGIGSAATQST